MDKRLANSVYSPEKENIENFENQQITYIGIKSESIDIPEEILQNFESKVEFFLNAE